MNVKIVSHTENPERTIACAGKLCYSKKVDIASLWESLTPEEVDKFIHTLIDKGHESPLEHASFTFAIEGVSRSLMAQITRHRVASFSIRSQRYCSEEEFDYVIPNAIANNEKAKKDFEAIMQNLQGQYRYLQDEYGLANEDVRAILPNACATRMIVTMNARELIHFFNERCCSCAQDEIRTLAYKMLSLVRIVAPVVFKHAGAKCTSLGYCPEGTRGCGIKPAKEEVFNNGQNS